MSKYNVYAKKLDEEFRKARDRHAEAFKAAEAARKKYAEAKEYQLGDMGHAYEKELRIKAAEYELKKAESKLKETSAATWAEYRRKRDEITADLESAIKRDNTANPEAVDGNALELLKAGALTVDDYTAFIKKYDGNSTMLKLISKYAYNAADKEPDKRTAGELREIAITCQSGKSEIMRAWNDICSTMDYFSGGTSSGRISDSHIASMGEKYDSMFADVMDSF